jgi:glutaconate CoA-transferase subunit B
MTDKYTNYTLQEMQVVAAAREIKDGELVIVGTGMPLLAANLAQKTTAPNLIAIYESGVYDSKPIVTPSSVVDSVLVPGSAQTGGLMETLGPVHAGDVDVGFLGGAQIDKYGNLNTHVIGNYRAPKARLPGSGGGNDIGSGCKRTIVMMAPHLKHRFPEKVDFNTTPGYFNGGKEREKYGFVGKGPSIVISNMGILRFDAETREMYLASYHPGVSIEQIKENTGWELKIARDVHETERPDPEFIRILRDECDPSGIFLKKE